MAFQLHYRGDVTPFDGSRVLGPATTSALYKATAATYDPDTDMTTVEFRPLYGEERHEYVQKILAEQRALKRNPLVGDGK